MIAVANDFSARILVQYRRHGYGAIRPVHGALLRNLELQGNRLTTLAERAGVTHRAMAKIVEDLVAQGFVTREPDVQDRRATRIRFTAQGIRLLEDSSRIIERIYADYSGLVGADTLEQLEERLFDFLQRLGVEVTPSGQQAIHSPQPGHRRTRSGAYLSHNLGRYLQLAGDDYHRRCAQIMVRHGHHRIRFDHVAVLSHLGLEGMSLGALADSAAISLQAMGKQVTAVQHLGYVESREDPGDRRVRRVEFTPAGVAFSADLLEAFREIDENYGRIVGLRRMQWLRASLARVIARLGLKVPARTFS